MTQCAICLLHGHRAKDCPYQIRHWQETGHRGLAQLRGAVAESNHTNHEGGEQVSDIKKGDRIKATSKTTDDIAEFTVAHVTHSYVSSRMNSFYFADFDFEVIKPEPKPLPNREGVVILNPSYFPIIRTSGKWYQFQFPGKPWEVSDEHALDRLRYAGSRLFDERINELNREEYI